MAAALLMASFATAISLLANQTSSAAADDTELAGRASVALARVLEHQGRTSAGSGKWHDDADELTQFGLASGAGRNFLSADKILALRKGLKATDDGNGLPDYPEVRTALGLDGYDFHLRSFPLVFKLDDPRFNQYRGLNAAYIGAYDGSGTDDPSVDVAVALQDETDHWLVKFTITCVTPFLSSPLDDVLLLTTKLKTGNGNGYGSVSMNHYSSVIDCNASPADQTVMTVRYDKIDLKTYNGAWKLTYDLESTYTGKNLVNNDQVELSLSAGTEDYVISAEPTAHAFWSSGSGSSTPTLILDKLAKSGDRYAGTATVDVTVTPPSGGPVTFTDFHLPADESRTLTMTGLTSTASLESFNVTVASANGTGTAGQVTHFMFTDTEQTLPSSAPTAAAAAEIAALKELMAEFEDDRYRDDSGNTGLGDIYRDTVEDTRQTLADAPHGTRGLWTGRDGIEGNTDDYDVLVVGSGVKSAVLTGGMVESARDWVEEGNTMIVLGVDENNAQWLNSEFNIQLVTASGAISAPDPTHAILTSPEALNYQSYDNEGRVYEMTGNNYEGFSHALVTSNSGSDSYDTLAVSNPGVYGDGTLVLASFIPLTMTDNPDERMRFLNNVMTQSLGKILLDYGPAIPEGVSVGSATRLAVVPHPQDETVFMETKLVLYVWK